MIVFYIPLLSFSFFFFFYVVAFLSHLSFSLSSEVVNIKEYINMNRLRSKFVQKMLRVE